MISPKASGSLIACRDINGAAHLIPVAKFLPRDAVYGVIHDQTGRILVVRDRSASVSWDLPGGGVEPAETHEETLRREVREETGLEVSGELSPMCNLLEYFFDIVTSSAWISHRFFYLVHASGDLHPDGNDQDIVSAKFIPPSELETLSPVTRQVLAMFGANG